MKTTQLEKNTLVTLAFNGEDQCYLLARELQPFNQFERSDFIITGKITCFYFAIKGYRQSARENGEDVYVRQKLLKIMAVDSLVTPVLKPKNRW